MVMHLSGEIFRDFSDELVRAKPPLIAGRFDSHFVDGCWVFGRFPGFEQTAHILWVWNPYCFPFRWKYPGPREEARDASGTKIFMRPSGVNGKIAFCGLGQDRKHCNRAPNHVRHSVSDFLNHRGSVSARLESKRLLLPTLSGQHWKPHPLFWFRGLALIAQMTTVAVNLYSEKFSLLVGTERRV